MPGLPVHPQLLELTQTHVHQVGDAIQPSRPLSSPSPPAPNPSQHQGLSHEVAKVLEFHFSISPSNEYSGLISFRCSWGTSNVCEFLTHLLVPLFLFKLKKLSALNFYNAV